MSSNDQQQQYNNGPSSSKSNSNNSNTHSCEICGMSEFTDEKMIEHTQKCHVENEVQCPFCELAASSSELLLHVNQAHLDYLTPENPENELMSFIDDSKTPSGDDSDSMSCGLSPSITEIVGIDNVNMAASTSSLTNGHSSKYQQNDYKLAAKSKTTSTTESYTGTNMKVLANSSSSSTSNRHSNGPVRVRSEPEYFNYNNNVMDDNNNTNNNNINNNCDNGGANGNINGVDAKIENNHQQHGEGSPLRSQLGLKLKANKPKTLPSIPSPLVCFMCPYTANDPNVLEEHINRSHFDPVSPGINNGGSMAANQSPSSNHVETTEAFACPICVRVFSKSDALELHVNHEHSDILSPAKVDSTTANSLATGTASKTTATTASEKTTEQDEAACNLCPVCFISLTHMKTQEMELHIEAHFKSPSVATAVSPDLEKEARKQQEQREFEMLRGMFIHDFFLIEILIKKFFF